MGRMISKIVGAILALWAAFAAMGWIFAMLKTFVVIGLIAAAAVLVVIVLARRRRRV
jgi:L-asparagine transporter-like permease